MQEARIVFVLIFLFVLLNGIVCVSAKCWIICLEIAQKEHKWKMVKKKKRWKEMKQGKKVKDEWKVSIDPVIPLFTPIIHCIVGTQTQAITIDRFLDHLSSSRFRCQQSARTDIISSLYISRTFCLYCFSFLIFLFLLKIKTQWWNPIMNIVRIHWNW